MITKEDLYQNLSQILKDCENPNWDAYNALSANKDSYHYCKDFIEIYPETSDYPLPEAGIDPDGEFSLEWYQDRKILSVSFSPNGKLCYAGSTGQGSCRGVFEPSKDKIPELLLKLIRQVYES